MPWWLIALISVFCVHGVNIVLYQIFDDDAVPFMCAIVWFPLWVLLYPLRAWKTYSFSSGFYKKHGISRLAFLFGKHP